MTFINFMEEIKKEVLDFFKKQLELDDIEVEIEKVTKSNGRELFGLLIKNKEQSIIPNIYLEPFYEDFCEGRLETIYDCVLSIVDKYFNTIMEMNRSNRSAARNDFLKELTSNYSIAKDMITMKLINTASSEDFLKKTPSCSFGDLSLIFVIVLYEKEGILTITISEDVLNLWNVSKNQVFEQALLNMDSLSKTSIASLKDLMMKKLEDSNKNIEEYKELLIGCESIYILSNQSHENGAAALVDTKSLIHFSEIHDSSFFVLPKNIHECGIFLDNGLFQYDNLLEELLENNKTIENSEDFLSDNIYYFDKNTLKLCFAKNKIPLDFAE